MTTATPSKPLLSVSKSGSVTVAALVQSEVHEVDAPRLQQELVALAEQCDPADVVLDLAAVTFLTSSGIGAVIRGGQRCFQRGGNLVLCNLSKAVAGVFAPFPRRVAAPGGGAATGAGATSGSSGPGSGSGISSLPLIATDTADALRQLAIVRSPA